MDFPAKWFEWGCWGREKRFWKWLRSISEVPLSPLSSALRAPSPSREKVLLRFWKQWILQLRANPACRMTWGWGESGRRNQFIKMCRYQRHEKICFCSILYTWITQKNQCWWHQSTTNARSHSNYCEQHQYQCVEHLQAINKASTSNERNINQCTQRQYQCLEYQ